MKRKTLRCFLALWLCGFFMPSAFPQAPGTGAPLTFAARYACEEDLIEVIFAWGSQVRLRNGILVDLRTHALDGVDKTLNTVAWHEWQRITDVAEAVVDSWEINGERNTGQDLCNLNNIYRLRIPQGSDVWKLATELEALEGIDLARPVPKPVAPPLPGNYQSMQGYLNPATNNPSGVDALYAWTKTGGTGTGVTVCDLEYSWNYNHGDITKALGSQINTNPYSDPFNDDNHGTAVIGVLVADNNGWGTTGICYGAGLKTCATFYNSTWNVPGAITIAINALSAGDVILLEQQWEYTAGAADYIPVEWWTDYYPFAQSYNAVYAAIVTAVANGIHVVEAGGNGNVNTGAMTWYGNSGAIIVGAGGATSTNDRTRLYFSSYGPRFDMQGWGENVMTTGYGTYYNTDGVNYYYTSTFNGTSSASPVVAGALACAEGYYMVNVTPTPPSPSFMRTQLINTGTAQVTPPSGNIGPRPNIKGFILTHPPVTPTLDFGDAPDLPYPTLLANNGARHFRTTLKLGNIIDVELDGQPSIPADGDDINPPVADDEDGVTFSGNLIPGQVANVTVVASAAGVLNAWVDFNKVNIWSDPGEFIFNNVLLTPGINNLNFPVPASALPGYTYARFRFNSQGGLLFYGAASDGEVEDYRVWIEESQDVDWGDAPDGPYPTLGISNGACHNIDGITYLGSLVDPEPDGQPDPAAMGDDMDILYPPPSDDEDGVTFSGNLVPNQAVSIQVVASTFGFLNLWIDYNLNGSWGDPGEHVFTDLGLPAGINALAVIVPPNAAPGLTYARFRFCTLQGLNYYGQAPNGEVEDYSLMIESPDQFDWGDAPDQPYPTFSANSGAYHFIDNYTYLGYLIDQEPDGQPHPSAMGDDLSAMDDEDGVRIMSSLVRGKTSMIDVYANSSCILNAWFDFNGNGTWADPGEHVFMNTPLNPGSNILPISIPASAVASDLFSRFRVNQNGGLSYTGYGYEGEVEDYKFIVFDSIPRTKMSNPQYPDPDGWDVNFTYPATLGDDWRCTETGPVTDFHFWVSFPQDIIPGSLEGAVQFFEVGIYSDIPANDSLSGYSMPGELLWTRNFYSGQYAYQPAFNHLQGWYDPVIPSWNANDHEQCFRIDIEVYDTPFIQQQGTIYWLVISAHMASAGGGTQNIVITLDNVDPNIQPYQTWTEQGVILDLENHPLSGTCFYGINPAGIWLYPALLNLDLHGLPGTLVSAEIDIIDYCGTGCTEAKLFAAGALLNQDANITSGVLETLTLTNPGGFVPDQITITSLEGWVEEIRLVIELPGGYTIGWKSSADHWNDNAVYHDTAGSWNWHELYDPVDQTDIDLSFVITGGAYLDYGDAPQPTYPTTLAANGARHIADTVTYLGTLIDAEPDGQPDAFALGDDLSNLDDEDGVTFLWPLAKGNPCRLKVIASTGDALFNGWIDFNGNGSWAEANEHVFADINLLTGDNYLVFIVPRNAVTDTTYARFRFSHQPALSYTGQAFDGEVEDYMNDLISYGDLKWYQPFDKNLTGLHATDGNIMADDWICNGAVITDIHWWGNYEISAAGGEKRGSGINHFLVTLFSDSACLPENALISYTVPFGPGLEVYAGSVNVEGSPIYKYNFMLPQPFIQVKDTVYWVSVTAISNDVTDPPAWRWQEAHRWLFPIECGAVINGAGGLWQPILWPFGLLYKYSDMAFELSSTVVDTLFLRDIVVSTGQDLCWDATQVIVTGGAGTVFKVESGASAELIAGSRIFFYPDTRTISGAYLRAHITTTGDFCVRDHVLTAVPDPQEILTETIVNDGKGLLRAWPNPTTGTVTLELKQPGDNLPVTLEVYMMTGERIFHQLYGSQTRFDLSLAGYPPGIYIVRAVAGQKQFMIKVMMR